LVVGLIVYLNAQSVDDTTATGRPAFVDPDDPAFLVNLWPEGEGEGILLTGGLFLIMGGLVAGASTVGAEWRAGTITTWLTWEPRRTRLLTAKFVAAAVLAAVIAFLLLTMYVAAFLPTPLLKGSTEGADAGWLVGLVGAASRMAVVTGLAALLGAAVATVGRNTTAAIGVLFGWVAVAEPLVRALKPAWQHWLLSENIGRFVSAQPLGGVSHEASTAGALLQLVLYIGLVVVGATVLFRRRDVAATA